MDSGFRRNDDIEGFRRNDDTEGFRQDDGSPQADFVVNDLDRHRNQSTPARAAKARARIDRERRAMHRADDARVADEKLPRRVVEISPRVRTLVVIREHAIRQAQQDQVESAGR